MTTKFRDWLDDELSALTGANVDVDNDKLAIVDDSADATKRISPKELVAKSLTFLHPGTGAVARSPQEKLQQASSISVRDFGAVCDDSTDDSAAIQKAIDYAGSTAVTRRSGIKVIVDGKCAIGTQLLIQEKSIGFEGIGWGEEGQAAPISYLRWIGAAGTPMLRVQDTQGGCRVADLRLIGKPAAKPSAAISLYQTVAVANSFHLFENIDIGDGLGGEASAGTGFVNGILIEGSSNQNNAECLWNNIRISGCSEAGIRQTGSQMGEHAFARTTINACLYGVRAVASIDFHGLGITNCTGADIYMPATDDFANTVVAQVRVRGFFNELSSRILLMDGAGYALFDGGSMEMSSSLNADGKYINGTGNTSPFVVLRNIRFTQVSAPATTPFIFLRANLAAAAAKQLILDGVEGLPAGGPSSNGIDVTAQDATDNPYVYFREVLPAGTQLARRVGHQHILGFAGVNFELSRNDISGQRTSPGMQHDSPAQLTGNQNDYNPSAAGVWRLTSDASRNITGIVPRFPGRLLIILNVGAQNIVLQNQNAGSANANKIITGTGADVTMVPDDTAILWYDQTTTRWRILNTH